MNLVGIYGNISIRRCTSGKNNRTNFISDPKSAAVELRKKKIIVTSIKKGTKV